MLNKLCKCCQLKKPVSEFYITSYYKDKSYYGSDCKDCHLLKSKNRYKEKVIPNVLVNPKTRLIALAKSRARKKGLEFDISENDIQLPEFCPVLGVKLQVSTSGLSHNSYSLDRIDPTLGYIKGNIQVMSHLANSMKHSANEEQLLAFAKWIVDTYS